MKMLLLLNPLLSDVMFPQSTPNAIGIYAIPRLKVLKNLSK